MKFNKFFAIIGGLVALFTLIGGFIAWENSHVSASDFKKTIQMIQKDMCKQSVQINVHILDQNAETLQKRIWLLEDRYNGVEMPQTVKEELRVLKIKLKETLKLLDLERKKAQ